MIDIFRALSAFTSIRIRRVSRIVRTAGGHPETLVVLNHPLWDLAGIGAVDHVSLIRRFLDDHPERIDALELNGYRSWPENGGAIGWKRILAPNGLGGDRHGCAPNAC